jgi:hypothetical protein
MFVKQGLNIPFLQRILEVVSDFSNFGNSVTDTTKIPLKWYKNPQSIIVCFRDGKS